MPAKDLKLVAIAAVAAVTLMTLMALAAPIFAAGQQRQLAAGVKSASGSPVARIDFHSGDSPSRNAGGGGAIDPTTGGLLLVLGGYGVWTTRPRRPKVAVEFDEATA
jgi:hypothetical protein